MVWEALQGCGPLFFFFTSFIVYSSLLSPCNLDGFFSFYGLLPVSCTVIVELFDTVEYCVEL